MNNVEACESLDTIRPSSSSLIRGPSWSLGVGASNTDELAVYRISADAQHEATYSSSHLQPDTSSNLFPKLSLTIPTVYLTKKDPTSSSYHVYQLITKTSEGDEWSVYRRYSQFYALHQQLKSKDSAVGKLIFPPKRRLNSKASTIVQDRRRKLEEYIRTLNNYIERLPPSLDIGEYQSQDFTASDSQSGSRLMSPCEASSLSDSADSEQRCHEDVTSTRASDANSRVVSFETDSFETKIGLRSLFHTFISLKEKKDELFDPANSLRG